MTEQEARQLQREIEDALEDCELGLLRAEESPYIPNHWGVTIKLTSQSDVPMLQRALRRMPHKRRANLTRARNRTASPAYLPSGFDLSAVARPRGEEG